MRQIVLVFVLIAAPAFAAEPGPQSAAPKSPVEFSPPPSSMLPAGSVAVPATTVQALVLYLADRSAIVAQLQAAMMAASQAKPETCPVVPAAK